MNEKLKILKDLYYTVGGGNGTFIKSIQENIDLTNESIELITEKLERLGKNGDAAKKIFMLEFKNSIRFDILYEKLTEPREEQHKLKAYEYELLKKELELCYQIIENSFLLFNGNTKEYAEKYWEININRK